MANRTKHDRLVDPDATSDERTYAVLMHLSLLANLLTGGAGIVVVIVMWLVKRNSSPFLDDHGREAINFQISLVIYLLMASVLTLLCGIGILLVPVIPILGLIGMVMAAVAANGGEYFRYPATIRFLH